MRRRVTSVGSLFSGRATTALSRRLDTLRAALEVTVPGADRQDSEHGAEFAARTLLALCARVVTSLDTADLWAIYVAVSTTYPDRSTMERLESAVAAGSPSGLADLTLEIGLAAGERFGNLSADVRLVSGVIVDVTFSAISDHNTGIQRVVRSAARWWALDPAVTLVAADGGPSMHRMLTADEANRVSRWNEPVEHVASRVQSTDLVIPWHAVVLIPEVPAIERIAGLSELARHSGNNIAIVAHDAIPITGREYVAAAEMERFARYLELVTAAAVVIAVSESAATEFRGIRKSSQARGNPGFDVGFRRLPMELAADASGGVEAPLPVVLVVGSREPRKNQDAVLYAAERLWREGLQFELVLVGAWGWSTRTFRFWLRRARAAGRPVSAPNSLGDDDLWRAYDSAWFTVFPSLQEGFGLPIVESLAHGVPVITSDYGSMAEIAEDGGCLTIDPRDDEQLVTAMRSLLVDSDLRGRLVREIATRPRDSWEQYAAAVIDTVGLYLPTGTTG